MNDLLIAGARIVDGSGSPAFDGFVSVQGDRIETVDRAGAPEPTAARRVDAGGRVLCPGFVDPHRHSDLSPFVEPWMDAVLRQGVTTVVVGNCGSSAWPTAGAPELATMIGADPAELDLSWRTLGEYLERVDAAGPSVNVAALVGHGTLREEVMGLDRRAPSSGELSEMRALLREGMEAGAAGMSTGLVYFPGMYADADEIADLASLLAPFHGVYASHIRGEGALLFEAVEEAIEIGRRAGVPVHLSHLKLEGEAAWGRAAELLAAIHGAREEGVDVTADQYPYTAWASDLSAILPPWAHPRDLPSILGDAQARKRLVRAVEEGEPGWQSSIEGVGWDRIVIEVHVPDPSVEGRSVAEIAEQHGEDPAATAFALLIEDPTTAAIGHAMREEDVREILADPDAMVGSDGWVTSPGGPLGTSPVHPRNYGTFPRVLGPYVREGVLSLETAVRKASALAADRFGLSDRGRIAKGAAADVVVLDPERIRDEATFADPHRFPEGIELVVVNGRVAWSADGGRGERAGRVLRPAR